jgi:small subunit ribosomal protein S1
VLDIDRDRQRISLGLKQTQEDPWQRVVDTYNIGDELEGTVTKVVTFGAFVEILDGVEGLVHISELAQHHVENPREIIQPGDTVRVRILEIDSERRRLSLSIKRVDGQILPVRPIEPGEVSTDLDEMPELGLSEDVFAPHQSVGEYVPAPDATESSGALESSEAPEPSAVSEAAPQGFEQPSGEVQAPAQETATEPAPEAATAPETSAEPAAAEPAAAEAQPAPDEAPAAEAQAAPGADDESAADEPGADGEAPA